MVNVSVMCTKDETEEKDERPMNSVWCLDAISRIRRFFSVIKLT